MMMFDAEADMVEWPQERRHRLSNSIVVQHSLADIPAELLREFESIGSFAVLVQVVTEAFHDQADPQTKLADLTIAIERPDAFGSYDETVRGIVLAMVGVAALRKEPTAEMWEYLWSLAWHSASLEVCLPEAVVAAATETVFRDQFFVIARSVAKRAAENPGRRATQRERNVGASLRKDWLKRPELSTLWRAHFGNSLRAVGNDDDQVLSIVAKIDPIEFVGLLALYDYPDPVAHALFWCGASWHFEHWRALASVAPTAFGEGGAWSESLILPLLLSIARDQFQFLLGHRHTPSQISEASSEIKSLAAEVARIVASRADAFECMTRWGNWLIRNEMPAVSANPFPHPTDATSEGFIDDSLLEALIAEMPPNRWREEPAPDAEAWEPWCQLAVGGLVALAGKAPMPSPTGFLAEWLLSLDEWPTQRGIELKHRAIPFGGSGWRADGYGPRLLAIPIVEAGSADKSWKYFWGSTATLREIVEFGDADETDSGGWQGRTDAAHLLMLQFGIGLMMLDHLIGPQRTLDYDRLLAIERLLPLLYEAACEMIAIDLLEPKFWLEAVRHLAIRRAKWVSGPTAPSGVALSAEAKPTLSDIVSKFRGDTESLLALVRVAQINDVDRAILVVAFKAAGVDINGEIAMAERLLAISPRAIGFSHAQLDDARKFLWNADELTARPGSV